MGTRSPAPSDRERQPGRVVSIAAQERFMRLALEEARNALHLGEVPIGAVVAYDQTVVSLGFNQPVHTLDPTAHAEVVALR